MGFLSNVWVSYFDRSAKLIKDSVITKMQANVPEITDYTDNNPYVKQIEIFAGTHEMLGYYVDNAGRESFVDSARLYQSMVLHARSFNYKITGYLPATADVVFTTSTVYAADIIIPKGTVVTTAAGIAFVTQNPVTITAGTTQAPPIGVSQYIQMTGVNLGTGTGLPNTEIIFADKVIHDSVALTIGGVQWTAQETLAYSLGTDTHYVQNINELQQVIIQFGNALPYGAVPQTAQAIVADYKITMGDVGMVEAGQITVIPNAAFMPSGVILSVTNPAKTVGGRGPETIEELRANIPVSIRTRYRAVTEQDFVDVTNMAPGVANAGVYFNCGKFIDIYIVPDGGGIASSVLLNNTLLFMNDRKIIGRKLRILPAGEDHIELTINVTAYPSYSNAQVQSAVIAALTDYYSYKYQTIGGEVFLSDIYEKVEETPGVSHSTVDRFVIRSYPQPASQSSPPLNWTLITQVTSIATQAWQILFNSNTGFQLLRGSVQSGTYNVGIPVTQLEMTFTVLPGTYSAGDSYQFYTYPYNPTKVKIQTPSLPISELPDLTINVSGGL